MFLLHGEAKYFDVLEQVLYNALLSGVSLSGDHFFYPNPLASMGQHSRSEWFGCACCPCNVTRLLPSIPGYIYAVRDSTVYVNLFIQNSADLTVAGTHAVIRQRSDYPWDGNVKIIVEPVSPSRFQLKLRIPGWVNGTPLPGDLYRFETMSGGHVTLRVNGAEYPLKMRDGYASIDRLWQKGDSVMFDLPMPIRRIVANDKVAADKGKVALQRGPLVYCAEGVDNPGGRVLNVVLGEKADLSIKTRKEMLGGIRTISGNASGAYLGPDGKTVELRPQKFLAIPYYAWANRGAGEMNIWFGINASGAIPLPPPTLALRSKISALHMRNSLRAVNGPYTPASSNDPAMTNFNWWPRRDTVEWIQYDFEKPETVSSAKVYWFDDRPDGGCRAPTAWRILCMQNGQWVPVKNSTPYGTEKDKFCEVTFASVTTTSVRLEVTLPKENSSGLYKWELK
jgi:hypothetical protein